MPLSLIEWFGHDLSDWSDEAKADRHNEHCPFIEDTCTKRFNDGSVNGVCSVSQAAGTPVVVCPNRMYADSYRILSDVSEVAFGQDHKIIHPNRYGSVHHDGSYVVAFGKRYGRELRLPGVGGKRSYFVDWILARIGQSGNLSEFVAVEIQTIDTTGSYRNNVEDLRRGVCDPGPAKAGLNWENVNKRILPQVIFKGHVLRREPKCTKGLFFVTTSPVHERIRDRLGGTLATYNNLQPGSLTFVWYGLSSNKASGRALIRDGIFSTTVDQVALAFTSPQNLPEAGVYETAINAALADI